MRMRRADPCDQVRAFQHRLFLLVIVMVSAAQAILTMHRYPGALMIQIGAGFLALPVGVIGDVATGWMRYVTGTPGRLDYALYQLMSAQAGCWSVQAHFSSCSACARGLMLSFALKPTALTGQRKRRSAIASVRS